MKSIACLLVGLGVLCRPVICRCSAKLDDKPAIGKRADLFGPDKIWTLHLKLGAKEYDAMQPKGGGMMMFPFPKKDDAPPRKKRNPRPRIPRRQRRAQEQGLWHRVSLRQGGPRIRRGGHQGRRHSLQGNSTYTMSAQGLKRPLKLDINHFIEGQKLHGLNGLSLGNGVADVTRIREALAFSIFRAAGVPASRTAFAKVYLTVADKHDKTYVGLYTLIEPVDKTFLKDHFKSDKGMLLKPEGIQGVPYLGEKWDATRSTTQARAHRRPGASAYRLHQARQSGRR